MPPGYNSSHTALLRAAAAARARDQQRMSISSRSTSRGKSPGHSKKPRSASARPGTSHGTHAGSGLAAARKQRSSAVDGRIQPGLAAPTGGAAAIQADGRRPGASVAAEGLQAVAAWAQLIFGGPDFLCLSSGCTLSPEFEIK